MSFDVELLPGTLLTLHPSFDPDGQRLYVAYSYADAGGGGAEGVATWDVHLLLERAGLSWQGLLPFP